MKNGFIKNVDLLEEKVSDKDYLNISSSVSTLTEKLQSKKGSQIIGIIGPFGVGKSTLIEQIRKQKETTEQWVHFDAWQFPERKELWDGLILETARQLSMLEKVKREVDGQSGKDKKLGINTAGSILNVATTAFGLPKLLEPLFGLVKNLEYFADKSPARRVFEIQDIFTSLINAVDKDKIVFVIEDIDRSGPDGLFFLETFRQFLTKNTLQKQVTVIVAVSNKSYEDNIETYLKCFDYIEFFNKKSESNLQDFVADVFEADPTDTIGEDKKLTEFLEYIHIRYPEMTMRKIKLILRQANLDYIELSRLGYKPNRLICIAVTASKYINVQDNYSYFKQFVKVKAISAGNEIARLILITNNSYLQYTNRLVVGEDKEILNTFDIKLIERPNPQDVDKYPSTPHSPDRYRAANEELKVVLPDFYFKNL